ncbi:hypothetical protein QBC35DRAFT_456759 [Podospora australis]|uniref:Uncharacterized protein n=1 Tax=Podospora australis TaxID=1536484 RepID=A0AAN6WIZ1_9PEZI|nr:hypothetical protein QBC35DRAFT_456759 [Podospora australis]
MASSITTKVGRAVTAAPFLALAAFCWTKMDIPKLTAYQDQILKDNQGTIKWGNESLSVLERFFGVQALDETWRGPSVTFSPSSLGYDAISWWQMISFLTDLGPVYIVWFLESARVGNAWTPAYFATFFAFAAQLVGIGSAAPVFYFLCLTFGPRVAELMSVSTDKLSTSKIQLQHKYISLLLPLVLVLHNFEVFAAYLSPDPAARHYWVWAWQMSPLWIGLVNSVLAQILPTSMFAAGPRALLAAACSISAGVWISVLLNSPYSLPEIFLPSLQEQADLVAHTRQALQYDEICVFSASFLWLGYQFVDLYRAGRMDDLFKVVAVFPIVLVTAGPGVTLAVGWYLREQKLTGVR